MSNAVLAPAQGPKGILTFFFEQVAAIVANPEHDFVAPAQEFCNATPDPTMNLLMLAAIAVTQNASTLTDEHGKTAALDYLLDRIALLSIGDQL